MSEIATGKLVIWMRLQAKRITPDGNSTSIMLSAAADRLERQEQTIAALTARAEKAEKNRDVWEKKWWEEARKKVEAQVFKDEAERERDAAIKDINRLCMRCKYWTCQNDEPCLSCVNAETRNPNWTWRGLPQEREGKENG